MTSAIQWVPAGTPVAVAGRTIPGGMLYVGRERRPVRGRGLASVDEPALVDPTLLVDWQNPDWYGRTMGYWPSYRSITPANRAAYLSWLATGRAQPSTCIGYVFLYFYGLERRALRHDDSPPPTGAELDAIADEVRRLLTLYGDNGSFHSYATGLLEILNARTLLNAPLAPPSSADLQRSWEVPLAVRVALGRYVAAAHPIPAAWALALLRSHPESYLRTPATRCTNEFDHLFARRYHTRFGAGLTVAPSATRIHVSYMPASAGFDHTYEATLGDLPDICGHDGPIDKLKDLATECSDALDAYSRLLGRDPDGRGTPAAVALLPDELLATHGGTVVADLRNWAADRLQPSGQALVEMDELVQRWAPGRDAKLAKADAVALAGLLAKIGIGIEPDVRFGASTPKAGSSAIVFVLPDGATSAPSSPYGAAATLVHLVAVVSTADGSVDDEERRHLARHLEDVLGLDPAERVRLEAHLSWLVASDAGLAGMKRKVQQLDVERRRSIGHVLVAVAAADGRVTPAEITVLTKLYRLLGLDETEVYSLVHALASGDTGPVTVREREQSTDRWAIPVPTSEPAAPPAAGLVLDPDKVRARVAETATVTALLAGIFVEEEPPSFPAPDAGTELPSDSSPVLTITGLDAAHTELAARLTARSSWSRSDAEDLATALGLPLLDGALDRINETAIDACGEPLAEGDDPIDLNAYAIEELSP